MERMIKVIQIGLMIIGVVGMLVTLIIGLAMLIKDVC